MTKKTILPLIGGVVVVVVVILALIFVPSKNNNNNSAKKNHGLSSAQKTADTNDIKTNFQTFFALSTTMQTREALLQNGSEFAQPMEQEFNQLDNEKPSVSISSVDLKNSTTANVVYTVDLNGQPVLKDQTGEALLINGSWKVSDSTLCQLFALGGQTPSICNNVK